MKTSNKRAEREIGVRELVRDAKRILQATQKGAAFVVRVHGKPVAHLVPHQEVRKSGTLEDFLALAGTAKGMGKNTSKEIDKIVYGA